MVFHPFPPASNTIMPLGSATRMTLCNAALFLPLTLQDQGFHKKMKKDIGSHRRGGNRVLGKPNAIIDRDALLKQPPDIVVKYITDGLESRPGEPTTRCADLRYSELRCAFFRNAIGSESGQLGQRDMILAAIWSVKNYVTEADVRKS